MRAAGARMLACVTLLATAVARAGGAWSCEAALLYPTAVQPPSGPEFALAVHLGTPWHTGRLEQSG
jgi:hypothetical protein